MIATLALQSFDPLPMPGGLFVSGAGFWAVAFMLLAIVVHIAFALGVYRDAGALEGRPALVAPWVWAAATLMGGVVVAVVYWAVHHSTLSRRPS